MPATIRELINADLLRAVRAISTDNGYANTVGEVAWAKSNGNPPAFTDVNGLHVVLYDEGDTPRDTSPISKDDYNATITIAVTHVESISSEREMLDRNASVWGDVKKALMQDRNRGTHPTNGGPLAFNTQVGTPQSIDDPNAQGVTIPVTVWYRTAFDDPFSQ